MFVCPYCYGNFRVKPIPSYIRIFHASPDAPPVDVYANDSIIARNLKFGNFTEYMPVPGGKYRVRVFAAGTKNNPVIDTQLVIPEEKIFTLAAIGRLKDISLKAIEDPVQSLASGKLKVKFAHLSPGAPPVDVVLTNGKVLFSNVAYGDVTNYVQIPPGVYNFNVRVAGTDRVVLFVPNIRLYPNKFYSIYAIGLVGGKPPLQVVIPLDGNTYLKF